MISANCIRQGDCLALLPHIEERSIDLVLCDPPYGTTANRWDVRLPFERMWPEFWRVLKPSGAVLIFCQQPFTSVLGAGQIQHLKYEWIWEKGNATGFLNAKRFPLKAHENILVFARGLHHYEPQMTAGMPYKRAIAPKFSSNYRRHTGAAVDNKGTRYPRSVVRFSHERGHHPTQKPSGLVEYLLRTYTRPGAVVLDPCAGSGTTAVAAVRSGRGYIVFEQDMTYCQTARQRVKEAERERGN